MDSVDEQGGAFERRLRKVPFAGIILAALSAVAFSIASFTVKLLPELHSIQIVVIRSIIQLSIYSVVIIVSKTQIKAEGERWPLVCRGLVGFVSFTLAYMAFHMIPLGDASAIIFSAPVYVSVFACLLLGEACGIFQVIVICITLFGAGLISKPTFIFGGNEASEFRLQGYLTAFVSSVATAMAFVFIRKLQKTPASVVIVWFSAVCIVLGTICLTGLHLATGQSYKRPNEFTNTEWLCLIGNGMCGATGQLFLTLALKLEEAGLVSLTRCSDIVIAYIFQVLFLNEPIHWTSLLGAAIVMSGVALSCIRKIILERRARAANKMAERS